MRSQRRLWSVRSLVLFVLFCVLMLSLSGCERSIPQRPDTQTDPTAADVPTLRIARYTLPNGLRVVLQEDSTAPTVSVLMGRGVGYRDEQPGQYGYAKLAEGLLGIATPNRPDPWRDHLRRLGADAIVSRVGLEWSWQGATVPKGALEQLLWLEADRLAHLSDAINDEAVKQARELLRAQQKAAAQQPTAQIEHLIANSSYPAEHPVARGAFGREADVNAATRRDLTDWFTQYYGARNSVLVVVGDIDSLKLEPKIEQLFREIPAGPPTPEVHTPGHTARHDEPVVITESLPNVVPEGRRWLYRLWTSPGTEGAKHAALSLAAALLAEGPNSRLAQALRQRSLRADHIGWQIDENEFGVQVRIHLLTNAQDDPKRISSVINETVGTLDKDFTVAELTRAKAVIRAQRLRVLDGASLAGRAAALAEGELLHSNPHHMWDQLGMLQFVTRHDVVTQAEDDLRLRELLQLNLESKPREVSVTKIPVASGTPALPLAPMQSFTLPNGLKVQVVERASSPLIDVRLIFDFGNGTRGVLPASPSVLLQSLTESTQNRDPAFIVTQLQEVGAQLTTHSSIDTSVIRISALRSGLERSLDLICDFAQNPRFEEARLRPLKADAADARALDLQSPELFAVQSLSRMLYGRQHPYAGVLLDTAPPEAVTALTTAELRELYARQVRPDRATILVVGSISAAKLRPLIERYFGQWRRPDAAPSRSVFPDPRMEPERVLLRLALDRRGTTTIYGGLMAPSRRDPKYVAVLALATLLQRDYTQLEVIPTRESSLITLRTSVSPNEVNLALSALMRAAEQLRQDNPLTADALTDLKQQMKRSQALQLQNFDQLSDAYADLIDLDLPPQYPQDFERAIDALTAEQLRRAARGLKEFRWVVIGDISGVQVKDTLLSLSPATSGLLLPPAYHWMKPDSSNGLVSW